jgi:carboxylate-amine ligase
MATAEACYATLEGILPWLPLVLALSANSPYLAGRATGLASNRAEVLAQLPRAGAPPAFGSYEAWESFVERLIGLGLADDYTRFWWDVRPHPRFGTLEIRMPDQPTSLAVTAALTALLQGLCASVDVEQARAAERGDYAQNRWAALRFGPGAELIHPDGTRLIRVPELARELSISSLRRQSSLERPTSSWLSIRRPARASASSRSADAKGSTRSAPTWSSGR